MGARGKKKSPPAVKTARPAAAPFRPKLLRLEEFVHMFKESVTLKQDIRYCFILGSGASITSGVSSGASLADEWLSDMHRRARPGDTPDKLRAWVEQEFRDLKDFTWANRADFYGRIYSRRFPENANGQSWLRGRMANKYPAFGYTVLARILSDTRHDLVLTTNFDNFPYDALMALPGRRPFIAHSPEEARFLANHDSKPRIVKLHGDIDRETYNAAALLHDLAEPWREPLRQLLGSYTPVFLGYGGCDPGFMRFLIEDFHPSAARPQRFLRLRSLFNILFVLFWMLR